MQDAGLLQEGDDPSSEQFANYLQRLNDLINLWQTRGLKLWLQNELTVPLVTGQRTYVLGPTGDVVMVKPMRILNSMFYQDTSSVRRPLTLISRDDWMRLSNITTQGALNSVFVDKQQLQIVLNTWLTPDAVTATGTLVVLCQNQVTNLIQLTDTMNFPQEWFIALRWGLADDIVTGQPEAVVQRCAMKAQIYLGLLEDWDVEDASTSFAPDTNVGYGYGGGFR